MPGRKYRPNPKSTPKEIVGSHGHRPHGPSILWPALYSHLRAKGMTKRKAAMISNGLWRKKHGLPPKSVRAVVKSHDSIRPWDTDTSSGTSIAYGRGSTSGGRTSAGRGRGHVRKAATGSLPSSADRSTRIDLWLKSRKVVG